MVYVKMINFSKLFRPWFGMDLFLLTLILWMLCSFNTLFKGINHCKSKAGEREFGFHLTFFSQPYALFIFFYFFILSLFICIIFFLPVPAFSCEFFIFCFFLPSLHFLNG